MDCNIVLPIEAVRRVAPAISTEETRYYLCGLRVEPVKGGVVIVATDGHILAAEFIPDGEEGAICTAPATVRLPKPSALNGKHATHLIAGDWGAAIFDGGARGVTLTPEEIIAWAPELKDAPLPYAAGKSWAIDGAYPEWRKVLAGMDCAAAGRDAAPHHDPINYALVSRLAASKGFKTPAFSIAQASKDAGKPHMIKAGAYPDWFAVVMPMGGVKSPKPDLSLPTWAGGPVIEDEAIAT